jgi:hypothetical protein
MMFLAVSVGGSALAQQLPGLARIELDSINVEAIYSRSANPGYTVFEDFGDSVRTGEEIRLYLRYTNLHASEIIGLTNGYAIYTVDMGGDGAAARTDQWEAKWWIRDDTDRVVDSVTGPVSDTITIVDPVFEAAWSPAITFVGYFRANSINVDTISFSGVSILEPGLPVGYDAVALAIHIGPIEAVPESHGDSLCVDSAYFPPGGEWLWATGDFKALVPDWGGPYCWLIIDEATGVESVTGGEKPETFQLNQNYPNPFNPVTTISFDVGRAGHVKLDVYNVLGQRVASLVDRHMERGTYEAEWEASSFSTGIYFYKLETESFSDTKKMLLLK